MISVNINLVLSSPKTCFVVRFDKVCHGSRDHMEGISDASNCSCKTARTIFGRQTEVMVIITGVVLFLNSKDILTNIYVLLMCL